MRIEDSVVVVTGAGSGIGQALAGAFAAAGARVIAGDIDESAAEATAATIRDSGGQAVAVTADATSPAGIDAMISSAQREFGPVDGYVANAGVMGPAGLGTDSEWDRVLDVNLRAHVRAAEALVPQWVSRGDGYFISVASAAGLLTQLGAAAYAVTKHATVGFAEWLAITYGDNGIGVSCVCPMGVETPLLHAVDDSADPTARLAARSITAAGAVLDAREVADLTLEAVRDGRFLVLPHPEVLDMYRQKGADYDRWIAGMRRYRRSLADDI
ncbi:SDR family oxidoreductase [Mycolicibacterium thermoresistibile]